MNTYKLTVIREAGAMPRASEVLTIQAPTVQEAYQLTAVYQTLSFRGQQRRILDEAGNEVRDARY